MNFLRELKGDFMWCYNDNRKKFICELVGCFTIMGGFMLLVIICSQMGGK